MNPHPAAIDRTHISPDQQLAMAQAAQLYGLLDAGAFLMFLIEHAPPPPQPFELEDEQEPTQ